MPEKEVDRLTKKLADLVKIFREGKKASDFKWWNSNSPSSIFDPLHGYQNGKPLFEEVVQGVLGLNSEMLSEHEIETKLVYDFLQMQTISDTKPEHLNNQSLINEVKTFLNELIAFEAWQDVDVAIANLWLEGKPAKLGEVTFIALTEEEIKKWKSEKVIYPDNAPDARVIAHVKAPGDRTKAITYTLATVNQVLDILRAFCFPFGRNSDGWQIGLVGDIISSTSTPMRINNRRFVARLGASPTQIELRKHILSKLQRPQWGLINKLIQKSENSRSNMESKLLDGIHWLAESTKPDTNNSKFAKISIALETLIGGEPQDEELKIRGITAMLAERAAFIAGKDLDNRLAIDHDIREYYGKRSSIVHGNKVEISLDDIDGFGQLVRRLALALLEKLDELGDELGKVEKLANWVKMQKYTLPNHDTEGGT